MSKVENRYDFVLLFDVQDGNPNGDPDAGNLPRMDPETGHGLVTDVCLKRKIRNYVLLTKPNEPGYDIYVKEKAVLGRAHFKAFEKLGITTGQESRTEIPNDLQAMFEGISLPDGLSVDEHEDDKQELVVAPDADNKVINQWLKDNKPDKKLNKFIKDAIKNAKSRKPTKDETEKGRDQMCKDFYDIRTFGAVLSLKSAPNCGQVRGPVQLTFARSVDQILQSEHSITRMAVATEEEAEKQSGDNRTMGRKFTVPYGLYRCQGFISAPLAEQTGFSTDDLDLFWEAVMNMFEHDRSAARGLMTVRGLKVFKHNSKLGKAPAHSLFERVTVSRKTPDQPIRSFSDYNVSVDTDQLPDGVTLDEKL